MADEMKSLAHPDWPYTGTAHEWRGFVKDKRAELAGGAAERRAASFEKLKKSGVLKAVYQKQNFGPELK